MFMKKKGLPVHGWVVFDKPLGMSSTQAVGKIRWLFNAEKAGHGGTLDPLATGLLPIALGEATKTVQWAMDGRKVYRFRAQWGTETTTDDLEGEVSARSDARPEKSSIDAILNDFVGEIMQAPPVFSAIKINGERAYDLARAGEAPEMALRPVFIEGLKLLGSPERPPPQPSPQGGGGNEYSDFEVTCGKGTYIRSLARDMGRKLGCLAHVTLLRRVSVGSFTEKDMISLEMLEELRHRPAQEGALQNALHSISTVLDGIPALAVMDGQAAQLRQGQTVLLRGAHAPITCEAVLVTHEGRPLGICEIAQGSLKTKRLFNL
ncbi:MAG: tRNA pseudouridine(55) synthase TruB [Alphaproteobacteria bacterium]|nr:tRNA pseudouridine(55) synthase TruB [Alphaproteobacteria bacterium]